jgi:hypothetical protein
MAAADVAHEPEPRVDVAPPPAIPAPAAQAVPLPEKAGAPATESEPPLAAMAAPVAVTPPPAQESKVEVAPEAPVLEVPPPSALSPAEDSASVSVEATAPATSDSPAEAPLESEARVVPPEPVELPPMPTGEMEVSSNWEPLEQSGADANLSQVPTSPWQRRAIEVDFSTPESGSIGTDAAQGDEIPLASVHEFIPTWQPSAEPEAGAARAEGAWAGSAEDAGVRLQFQEALEALRQATTRGALGKALLSYCRGRFPRGFLLGETFGLARVGRGYGPGSDKHAVSALQVDLEAPSILASAAANGRPIISSVPESQEDEQLFGALGESFSHLMAAPIRLHQRTVAFVVIDGGPSPFGSEELQELEQLISEASEVYGRLNDGAR